MIPPYTSWEEYKCIRFWNEWNRGNARHAGRRVSLAQWDEWDRRPRTPSLALRREASRLVCDKPGDRDLWRRSRIRRNWVNRTWRLQVQATHVSTPHGCLRRVTLLREFVHLPLWRESVKRHTMRLAIVTLRAHHNFSPMRNSELDSAMTIIYNNKNAALQFYITE